MLFANEPARGCDGGTGSQGGGALRGGGSFVTKVPGRGAGLQPRLGGRGDEEVSHAATKAAGGSDDVPIVVAWP